jgi:hypothetical protein
MRLRMALQPDQDMEVGPLSETGARMYVPHSSGAAKQRAYDWANVATVCTGYTSYRQLCLPRVCTGSNRQ